MQSHRRLWVRRLLREVEEEVAAVRAVVVVVLLLLLLPRRDDDDYRRYCCCWPHLHLRHRLRREYELSSPNHRTRESATQVVLHHHHHSAVAALAVGVLAVEEDGLDAAVAVAADVARREYV